MDMGVYIQVIKPMSVFLLLLMASVCDIKKRTIPDQVCFAIAIVSLFPFSFESITGLFAALPLFTAALCTEGMGGGDVKLSGACGMFLGFAAGMSAVILAFSFLILVHAGRKLIHAAGNKKKCIGQAYPLAPFLLAGVFCVYLVTMI